MKELALMQIRNGNAVTSCRQLFSALPNELSWLPKAFSGQRR
jgi:hypothetical protein